MKNFYIALLLFFMSFMSACAYRDGLKADQAEAAANGKKVVIDPTAISTGEPEPSPSLEANTTASKMLSPLKSIKD